MSLTQQLKIYFRDRKDQWINGSIAEDYGRSLKHKVKGVWVNYKSSNVSRRLREAESGIDAAGNPCEIFLVKDKLGGTSINYKYKSNYITKSIPTIVETGGERKVIMQDKLFEV